MVEYTLLEYPDQKSSKGFRANPGIYTGTRTIRQTMSKKKKAEEEEEYPLVYNQYITIKKGGKLIIHMKDDARIMSGQPAPPPKPPGS